MQISIGNMHWIYQDTEHTVQNTPSPIPNGPRIPTPSQQLLTLQEGNQQFRDLINTAHPGFFEESSKRQDPPFFVIGCSDSRVSEGTIFNTLPGTIFAHRNISNQFHSSDTNAYSVLAYAVAELGVSHVIVLGHYGCGGVDAAIHDPPKPPVDAAYGLVQAWIEPIRELYRASTRVDICVHRDDYAAANGGGDTRNAAWRALVEENVKMTVSRIASTSVIANHFAKLNHVSDRTYRSLRTGEHNHAQPVFIHGWVYDIANGDIFDLGVSVGPPGIPLPTSPFPKPSTRGSQA